MKNISSFTLIELLIVIVIIGILATALIPRIIGAQASARDTTRIMQIRQVQSALAAYYADHKEYPGKNDSLTTGCGSNVRTGILEPLVTEGYLSSLPIDPSNDVSKSLCYHYSGNKGGSSGRFCNNKRRTDYEYTIFFTLEKSRSDIYKVTTIHADTFNHCITGELR